MPKIVRYTSKTFEEIKADLIAYIKERLPQWTDFLESDFGVVLVELFAGIADMTRFYQNVTATESFPSTARLFESLCRHAEWLGYHPHPASAARVDLVFTKADVFKATTIPAGTRVSTVDGGVVFETTEDLYLPPGQASGTVGAIHGQRVSNQIIGVSTGEKNQRFKLLTPGLVMLEEGKNALTVSVDGEEWKEYSSLVWAAEANGYRVWIDANRDAWIVFGDGTFGNVPPEDAVITADYIVGGGVNGNVGAHTLTQIVSAINNIESVDNPKGASGGGDAESLEELRAHIPSAVMTRGRAVTRDDYARLLEAFGEIDKVEVEHDKDNIVRVYVLAQGGSIPSEPLLESVRSYLSDIRMITEDVRVLPPTPVPVNISATVTLAEDSPDALDLITADLRVYLRQGEFSRTLYVDDVYNFFGQYNEVEHVTITELARDGESGVNDISAAPGEIITDGVIQLTT